MVSTATEVPLSQAIGVIEAARGVACDESGAGCVLPDVLLRSDGAHAYPLSAEPPADPRIWLRD